MGMNRGRLFMYGCVIYALCFIFCSESSPFNKIIKIESDLGSTLAGAATNVTNSPNPTNPLKMQLGMLAFYFEKEPMVHFIPDRTKKNSMLFFFPQTTISKDLYNSFMSTIDAHNQAQNQDSFTIQCEKVKKPIEGIRLIINYDTHSVIVDKKMVRSRALEPGVVFNFYNKKLLDNLKNKTKSVLNVSYKNRADGDRDREWYIKA